MVFGYFKLIIYKVLGIKIFIIRYVETASVVNKLYRKADKYCIEDILHSWHSYNLAEYGKNNGCCPWNGRVPKYSYKLRPQPNVNVFRFRWIGQLIPVPREYENYLGACQHCSVCGHRDASRPSDSITSSHVMLADSEVHRLSRTRVNRVCYVVSM